LPNFAASFAEDAASPAGLPQKAQTEKHEGSIEMRLIASETFTPTVYENCFRTHF
jgi:hypothetical protein